MGATRYPRRLSGSSRCEIEAEFSAPRVQLGELPGLGPHRQMFMPWSGFMETEFRNELVHLGVELDQYLVRIMVVTGNVMACRVPRRTPELVDPRCTKVVRRDHVI